MNSDDSIKILFLAADPSDVTRLRLGQELRDIREKLQLSKHRDRFVLEPRESVRPGDISQAIFDVRPQIVHFSGHGLSTGQLCFENLLGQAQPVEPQALAALFKLFADQVECVILNACYSETQAKAIAEYIPFVIGMSKTIGDKAAIAFAGGFYRALGASCSIEKAHEFGCVEIGIEGIPEAATPVIHMKQRENLSKCVITLRATFEQIDEQQLKIITDYFRQVSGDISLTLEKVEPGSVKLTFEGSPDGFKRIEQLLLEGKLTEVLGMPIDFQTTVLPKSESESQSSETFDKSTLSEHLKTLEAIFTDPPREDIPWSQVLALIETLGGESWEVDKFILLEISTGKEKRRAVFPNDGHEDCVSRHIIEYLQNFMKGIITDAE